MKLAAAVQSMGSQKKHTLQGHTNYAGLSIAIENKKGSVRSGVDANGKPWSVKMPFDYGYIEKTKGPDGDQYDCFIGPSNKAEFAYVVHQSKQLNKDQWDEDKVMLGFDSADAAIRAYKSAYNNVDLFHSMSVMPMGTFKKKVLATQGKKRQDKLHAQFEAIDDYRSFREGTAIQPITQRHPPSLKNPIDVEVDNPDTDKKARTKKNRKQYMKQALRQTGKPELVNTVQFAPEGK